MSNSKEVTRGISLYIDGKPVENTIKSIESELRRLRKEQKMCTIGSEEYVQKTKQIQQCSAILQKHRSEIKGVAEAHSLSLKSCTDFFQKYTAAAISALAALTGVILKLNALRKLNSERQEAKADVKALTGLGDDDIDWLENNAKKLSTTTTKEGIKIRQSASDILEAYKLVGSAKPDLLKDKEALAEVTKQTMILSQASGMELKDAVDAVTLAMNQYGASANEAGKYANVMAAGSKYGAAAVPSVTAAVTRAGVAASSANVPIEQLVGTIEMLAEKGIKDDIAGTGLKRFLGTLQKGADDTNPRVVGLQKALENLKKEGLSYAQLNKMFGERAVNVASVLVNNAEKVDYYTKAVTNSSVAIEQAAIMSNTPQAKMAQLRNDLNEMGITLVQELQPAISGVINLVTKGSKTFIVATQFIIDHRESIKYLIIALGAYTLAVKGAIIVDRLKAIQNSALVKSFQKLWAVMLANPWAALLAVAAIYVGYMADVARRNAEAATAQSIYNKTMEESSNHRNSEIEEMQKLFSIAKDETKTKQEREEAIKRLNKISPEYLGNLTLETINTKKAGDQMQRLVNLMKIKDQIEDVKKARDKFQEEMDQPVHTQGEEWINKAAGLADKLTGHIFIGLSNMTQSYDQDLLRREAQRNNGLKFFDNKLNTLYEQSVTLESSMPSDDASGGGGGGGNGNAKKNTKAEKDKKITAKRLNDIEAEYLQKEAELKQKYYQSDIMTHEEYSNELQNLEMEKLDKQLTVAKLEPKQRQDIANKIMDMKVAMMDKIKELENNSVVNDESSSDDEIAKMKRKMDDEQKLLDFALSKKIITQERHDLLMRKLQDKYNADSRKADEKAADKRADDLNKSYNKEVIQLRRQRLKENMTDKQYNDQMRKLRIRILNQMLSDQKLSNDKRAELSNEVQDLELQGEEENKKDIEDVQKEKISAMKDGFIELGSVIGSFLTSSHKDFKEFAKDFIKTVLDTLEKVYLAGMAQITIRNISEIGFMGLAKAALEQAKIAIIFEAAKAAISNFYTGGFTADGSWDQPQGVVHSNEFVANRYALANPAVMPVLRLIDNAQRNNTIGNLSSADIAATAQVLPTAMPKNGNNNILNQYSDERMTVVMERLGKILENPLMAYCYINGKGGIKEAQDLVNKMNNNVRR